ncbi:Tetratricopeptide repeat protein [compost metagenome]
MVYQGEADFEKAIYYLKKTLELNMDNQEALYELAYCYDILDRQEESVEFYKKYIDSEPYSYYA